MEDTLYHTFHEIEKTHWWCVAHRDISAALIRQARPEGGRFLDIGCGTGYLLESLNQEFECWGLDQSDLAISMCQQRGLTRVFQGSATDLQAVKEQRFDVIGLFDVIEHLDDDLSALTEAKALLAPGGAIVITVPAFGWLWSRHDDVAQHKRRYRQSELADVLTQAGLQIRKLSYFNTYLFPIAVARRLGRRWLNIDNGVEFDLPPHWLNAFLFRMFSSETPRLLKTQRHNGFPFGLSLLAVAYDATDAAGNTGAIVGAGAELGASEGYGSAGSGVVSGPLAT